MSIQNRLMAGAALVVVVLLGTFIAVGLAIGSGVHDASTAAINQYGGERVDALIAVVDSPRHSLTERNRAVWALGQLGEARALPTLERHHTGATCDHARFICQRELTKAIRACHGSTNVSAFLWR